MRPFFVINHSFCRVLGVYLKLRMKKAKIVTFLTFLMANVYIGETCTAFYCLNSCGSSRENKGLKLIVAVNRDEQVDRRTIPADVWPAKNGQQIVTSSYEKLLTGGRKVVNCDQSKLQPPYNLCVYGPLDLQNDVPPRYYSTWLGELTNSFTFVQKI
jgi:hypothetical protein